ncbi:uncharacterized protein LOC131009888 [Salvia miltiorrhiza]|uniref:uncharacterized protein LOC131009888 n=1 Tax=Salvia miltiorrhiza TaxID=226208 RepID=UPI0025ACE6A5|nr:uncharacterized protein LOC131009888 [Salvia miltiorrhiza]
MGLEEDEIIKRNEATTKMIIQMKNRDSLLIQKSRSRWLKDGDVNSGFFHKVINGRRLKNEISGLSVKDSWIEKPKEVKREVKAHFEAQFRERSRVRPLLPEDFVHKKIPDNTREWLDIPFTEDEIKTAVWNCEGGKSPGPDGFNFNFMKKCWGIIKGDLLEVMKEFHAHGKLARGYNPPFIALISKKEDASELKEFRPISLINCLYKAISKVLASKLKQVMHLLISECQSAFVEGRYILDGVIVLNKIIEEAKRRKKGITMFKIDFAIAYDTVDWDFLDIMLEKMNFSPKWRRWISGCLGSASANVLVNAAPPYADDTMFVATDKRENASAFKSILKLFELLSGLAINFDKNSLVGVGIA